MSQITTFGIGGGGGGGPVITLQGNSGGLVGPNGTGNINIVGAGNITVAGNAGTNTETISFTGVLPIANGGTNASGFFPTDGTIYYDGTRLVATATGNAGFILTSNGVGVAPTYQSASASGAVTSVNAGANISITGTATAPIVNVAGTTIHSVQVGTGSTGLTQIAVGTTGQVLTGVTGSDPVWASPAASSISITGDSGGALSGAAFTFTGGTTGLTFAGAVATETLGGTLVVSNGGTGRATLTNHGLLVGAGTVAITQLGVASNGQLPIGSGGADPVLATITPGTGISITNGAGSITIAATGAGFTWYDVTIGAATLAAESGYIADAAGLTTFTMPTNNVFGDTIKIVGKGAGGWKVIYGAGQNIIFGSSASTITTGNIASTNANDCVEMVCTTSSITAPIFTVVNAVGNISIT